MSNKINSIFKPVAPKMLFKVLFFIFGSGGHLFSGAKQYVQLWLRALWGTFM